MKIQGSIAPSTDPPRTTAPTNPAWHGQPSAFELWKALAEEYSRLRDHARTITLLGIAAMAGVMVANRSFEDFNAVFVCTAIIIVVIVHTVYLHWSVHPRQCSISRFAAELETLFRRNLAAYGVPMLSEFAYFAFQPGPPGKGGLTPRPSPDSGVGLQMLSAVFVAAGLVAITVIGSWRVSAGFLVFGGLAMLGVMRYSRAGAATQRHEVPEQAPSSERPGGDSNARPAA